MSASRRTATRQVKSPADRLDGDSDSAAAFPSAARKRSGSNGHRLKSFSGPQVRLGRYLRAGFMFPEEELAEGLESVLKAKNSNRIAASGHCVDSQAETPEQYNEMILTRTTRDGKQSSLTRTSPSSGFRLLLILFLLQTLGLSFKSHTAAT